MTPRENLLHLLRKEGYEEVPVDFSLCPSQEESYRKTSVIIKTQDLIFSGA